jgi:NAD(P)-dependent dehydrogenase (short-subunit alcohol dehydrogenase family)
MAAQKPAGGAIYNMEGLGSDGRMIAGLIPYGTTKYALRYLTKGLAKEVEGTPVRMCHLSPGMVTTDLLVGDLEEMSATERAQRVKLINILADKVETVTPWLAARILANRKNGNHIAWLTGGKVAIRFLLAPFRKRSVMQ